MNQSSSEHKHTHNSCQNQSKSALVAALVLTSIFTIVEFLGGLFTNSLALIADAGHMLTDVAALGLSLFAIWFSSRPATPRKTYGFFRVEILAALLNGVALVVISLMIFYEAHQRILNPPEVNSGPMLLISCLGLVINLVCAALLHRSHRHSLNMHGAFLHVVGDALGSVGAIVAGILMIFKQWYVADPLMSIVVGLLILYSSWQLVRESVDILLEGTPAHIDLESVRAALCGVGGVASIHDLHVWTLTSGLHALSCHAVLSGNEDRHQILEELSHIVRNRFKIEHTTIQLEEVSLQHQEMTSCH